MQIYKKFLNIVPIPCKISQETKRMRPYDRITVTTMKRLSLIASALAVLGLTACEKGLVEDIADVSATSQVTNSDVKTEGATSMSYVAPSELFCWVYCWVAGYFFSGWAGACCVAAGAAFCASAAGLACSPAPNPCVLVGLVVMVSVADCSRTLWSVADVGAT